MKLPPLNALRAFEAAARHRSFSRAGDELHVTHAAISHQIKNLESWFGTALFHREGRGVRLTSVGETLFAGTSPLLEEISATCDRVSTSTRSPSLIVGCIPSIASRWLVPRLPDFSANHPAIEIQVLYAHADNRILDGNLDVLITSGKDESEGIISEKLFSRVNQPVCAPHYLDKLEPLDSPTKIALQPLLHDETRNSWQEWFATAGIEPSGPLGGPVFQDFNLLATSVVAGHGVALCPVEVFRREIARGDLQIISEIKTKTDKAYYIIYRTNSSESVCHFVSWFTASIGEQS